MERNFGAKEDGSLAWGKLKAKWGEAAIEGRIEGGSGGDKSGKSTGDYVGRAYDVDVVGVARRSHSPPDPLDARVYKGGGGGRGLVYLLYSSYLFSNIILV